MRIAASLLLMLCLPLVVTAQDAKETPEEPWLTEIKETRIPMRDGKSLAAKVLLPKTRGKYPCVLVQTPYNKDRMGREYGDNTSEVGRGSEKAFSLFDRENYAYVFVDWRGFYASKDAAVPRGTRGWRRGQDGYDCVEWCAKQSWCDGKIGTWGGSALGKQQFDTAAEQPPHLVCAAPLIAYQGNRYEAYYEGGVLLESHVKSLDRLGFGVGEAVTAARTPDKPIWRIVRNQSYTPEKITVPCLLISGWWDNYPREIIEQYNDLVTKGGEGAKKHSRLVMGPWSHTMIDVPKQGDLEFKAAEDYSTKITIQFFDYFLRGKNDNGYDKLARVHAFQCHTGWVTGESWDKLLGQTQARWLDSEGAIVTTEPVMSREGPAPSRSFKYDPRKASPSIGGQNLPPLTYGPKNITEIEKRSDVLVSATPALEAPLAIRGEVVLKVRVWSNRADFDLHARLVDTNDKGESFLVGETIIRAKLRDGKTVQPVKAGDAVELTLRFAPHAYTWQKGHKLKLILTGGSTPRFERNTHSGGDAWDESMAQEADISFDHHGPKAKLELPVVP